MNWLSIGWFWSPKLYGRIAKYYDFFTRKIFRVFTVAYKILTQDLSRGTILDVGCGTGSLLAFASERGMRCFGMDTSPGMLELAGDKVNGGHFVIGDFQFIPFRSGIIDYVVETNAVSAVGVNGEKVCREMLRVCRQGGEVRIGDYAKAQHEKWWMKPIEWVGILIGDYAHDYQGIFNCLGYSAEIELINGMAMYQYVRVRKGE